jgi:PLD-like domain
MTIYANRNSKDVVRNAFYTQAKKGDVICVATPYFSYPDLLLEMVQRGCRVRIVVRLGPSTLPKALSKCLANEQIQIRYFTGRQFHSKLYIFGDRLALVGSANLTEAGMQTNHEICVTVTPESEDFDEIALVFQAYWRDGEVLTRQRLDAYTRIYQNRDVSTADQRLEESVKAEFGEVGPNLGIVDSAPPSADRVFLENYRRRYQDFLSAYRAVERAYSEDGRRLQPEDQVPLRIEVDQFFSFIRERHAPGDGYQAQKLREPEGIAAFAREHFDQWFEERWGYLDNYIPDHYATIIRLIGTKPALMKASKEDLFDALDVCHSFNNRFRFYSGGHETMRAAFLADNDIGQVRKVLLHLLYDSGDFVDRMGTCIFDPAYKLHHVGRSIIQEVYGWVNREQVPICNGRTVKALRYLGADVQIFT